tara:strand:- start:243 stop:869 length:627 start_codon:yes stop_codon:yes gene_type:complete
MTIEIKKSKTPVNYTYAINMLENRVKKIINNDKEKELIWFLEHSSTFTSGGTHKDNEILDKTINVIKTNRGGKITWHGPGQLICYFVISLKKRKKDIRKFINSLENSIIETLNEYNIKAYPDRKKVGIWIKVNNQKFKIGAIGIKVRRWIAYHGFSINITNDLNEYKKIKPCGLNYSKISSLSKFKKQNYNKIINVLEKKIVKYLKKI